MFTFCDVRVTLQSDFLVGKAAKEGGVQVLRALYTSNNNNIYLKSIIQCT